ncbi:uncharacterized protein [Rutidosis leptorrhynchoides]|uniref:uncharacterized protein n=1 Tax=Rutidosis leptorrhynchoides TaxID=125765 RepID=UPI003A998BE1
MTTKSPRRDGKCKADQISEEVTEISFPAIRLHNTSCAPIVVQGYLLESGYMIRRLHMDTGSSVDIMYEQCFRQLPDTVKKGVRPSTMVLSGFSRESAWPIGTLYLKLELRDDNNKYKTRTEDVEFCVMCAHSRYNTILGRISLQRFGAIPSMVHGLVKFPTKQGIATLKSNPLETLCASVTVKEEDKSSNEASTGCYLVINLTYLDQKVKIGAGLTKETKSKLRNIFITNLDVYSWRDADMTSVPRDVVQHHLNANVSMMHVRQKKRPMEPNRSEWLREEVNQLVKANILRKVNYQTWIANPILVPKTDGSWRLCVDFKDINKACPKDNYPLP